MDKQRELAGATIVDRPALIAGLDVVNDVALPTDKQQALVDQQEHAVSVIRFRNGLLLGLLAWLLFMGLDWLVASFVAPGPLLPYLALRLVVAAQIVAILLRLRRSPAPSPPAVRLMSAVVFVSGTVAIAVMCAMSGGLESHYAAGIPVAICGWGIFAAGRREHSVRAAVLMASSYPIVMLVSAVFFDDVAAQLVEPGSLTVFVIYQALIVTTAAFSVFGAHAYWSLRRQVFESRNIGKYRLIRRIGHGGSSEVWEVRHQGLKRNVAMKILRADRDCSSFERFQREIEATTALTHPNTVRIFDYGATEDGLYYYTMELLDGQTLEQLARGKPVHPARALKIMTQVCRALAEAHERGLVHRDIKPANIFLTQVGSERDIVKLLDFGIAKNVETDSTLTEHGFVVGSPHYLAPEVARGADADRRSDVYSSGATLYFLLAGRPPFTGKNVTQLMTAHVNQTPTPPSTYTKEPLPADLEDIVMRCLSKNPARRYDSAIPLFHALDGIRIDSLAAWGSNDEVVDSHRATMVDPLETTIADVAQTTLASAD